MGLTACVSSDIPHILLGTLTKPAKPGCSWQAPLPLSACVLPFTHLDGLFPRSRYGRSPRPGEGELSLFMHAARIWHPFEVAPARPDRRARSCGSWYGRAAALGARHVAKDASERANGTAYTIRAAIERRGRFSGAIFRSTRSLP